MKRTMAKRTLAIRSCSLALAAIVLSGCSPREKSSATSDTPSLKIAAASDLQGALAKIANQFEARSACRVVISFGSTGQLAQQIEHGAPFDVFASANVSHLEAMKAKNLILADTMQRYARGRIVLVVKKNSSHSVTRLEDLIRPEIKHVAIANPSHAPYGLAARQALERAGLWNQLEPKVVLGENVRQAMQYVETGNAEAGITALSLAIADDQPRTLIDETLHDPIEQTIAVLAGSKNPSLSREFVGFVTGPDGQVVLRKFGFQIPTQVNSSDIANP